MTRPQLLFLAHRIPYPPNKGDKIRSWNILSHLAETFDVHLGAFIDDPADRRYEDVLRRVCSEVCLLETAGPQRLVRAAGAWRAGRALSVGMWDDPRMHEYVRSLCDREEIGHVYVFSSQMAPYVLPYASGRRMIMMDFVDMDSDKFRQYAEDSIWPKSALYGREAKLLARFEKQVARAVDASLFVSDEEAALFKRCSGSYAHTVYALHNGVDLDFFSPDADFEALGSGSESPALVFTGAMDYRPNIDAAVWMATEILPLVQRQLPQATFTIVGSNPAAAVQRLARRRGVRVTGRVDDVRPHIAAADISVAPIRIARGVQNKVLEAMAMAKPVVATPEAHSGISAEPGRDLIVAATAGEFVSHIVELAGDAKRRKDLGAAARERVEAEYSWPLQMALLDRLIDRHEALARPVA